MCDLSHQGCGALPLGVQKDWGPGWRLPFSCENLIPLINYLHPLLLLAVMRVEQKLINLRTVLTQKKKKKRRNKLALEQTELKMSRFLAMRSSCGSSGTRNCVGEEMISSYEGAWNDYVW